jgi:hypothetical protein
MADFWRRAAALMFLAGATLALSAPLALAQSCELPSMQTAQRPDPNGPPTPISMTFIVADILGVDDRNQSIDADFLGVMDWVDPRMEGFEGCRFQVTSVWMPQVKVFNSADVKLQRSNLLDQVAIGPDGQVTYLQRVTGSISTYHDLHDFPFDTQEFQIEFGSLENDTDEIVLVADAENSRLSEKYNVADWRITGLSVSAGPQWVAALNGERSVFTATISGERLYNFYILKIAMPMLLIVAMSWSVFWVPPEKYEFQIGLGATSFLTIVMFQFTVGNYLPRLGYLTTLDKLVLWSTIAVFAAIANAFVTARMVIRGRTERARRMDRASRYLVPAVFLTGWIILLN